MKKIVIRKNVVFIILSSAVLCLMLAACKNFLNAGKVKEEIEQAIYINNHECPVATVEEPAFSDTGVPRNKTIIVSFTMPMDPAAFENSYDITDASGKSLINCFLPPVWSNDNKLVSIYADKQNLIDVNANSTRDIFYTFKKLYNTRWTSN